MLEGLAWEQFRAAGHPERFRDRIGVLVPAYNEADNVGHGARPDPGRGLRGRDRGPGRRRRLARRHRRGRPRARRVVARHVINRGGGAALRTGYRLLADSRREDRRHARRRRPAPARGDGAAGASRSLDGEVASPTARGCSARPSRTTLPREAGIVFFNRLVSFITRTHVTDCSNGYRAVRADVLPQLVLRQEQFHTSEFMIEAIKRGVPAKEVPVTVVSRLSGTRRSRPWSATGWGSRTRSSAPGCADVARERRWLGPSGGGVRGRRARGLPRPHRYAGPGRTSSDRRQVHVEPAAGADLDVDLVDGAAARAAALGLVVLAAVEDRRDQAEAAAARRRPRTRSRTSCPSRGRRSRSRARR